MSYEEGYVGHLRAMRTGSWLVPSHHAVMDWLRTTAISCGILVPGTL